MADVVKGNSMILYVQISGNYKPVACAKSCTYTTTAESIELAPYSSSKWKQYIYGRLEGTISGSGLVKLVESGQYSAYDIQALQWNQSSPLVKFSVTDPSSNTQVITQNVIIEEISFTGDAGGIANYSFSFRITGTPSITTTGFTPAALTSYKYTYTASGTVSTLTVTAMIGSYIDYFEKNGTKLTVIYSGTPTSGQIKLEVSTGIITFGTALVNTDSIMAIYLK